MTFKIVWYKFLPLYRIGVCTKHIFVSICRIFIYSAAYESTKYFQKIWCVVTVNILHYMIFFICSNEYCTKKDAKKMFHHSPQIFSITILCIIGERQTIFQLTPRIWYIIWTSRLVPPIMNHQMIWPKVQTCCCTHNLGIKKIDDDVRIYLEIY